MGPIPEIRVSILIYKELRCWPEGRSDVIHSIRELGVAQIIYRFVWPASQPRVQSLNNLLTADQVNNNILLIMVRPLITIVVVILGKSTVDLYYTECIYK